MEDNLIRNYEELKKKAYKMLHEYKVGANEYTHNELVQLAESICSFPLFAQYKFIMSQQIVDMYEEQTKIKNAMPDVLSEGDCGEWFYNKKNIQKIDTPYFNRYKEYLIGEHFSDASIETIEKSTETILSKCADPENAVGRNKKKKGLVVGDVQSGKTANYLALINMACDYGYHVIIILAGMSNVLRKQTQKRVDRGIIGAASESISNEIEFLGVGLDTNDYYAITLTNTKYDFNKIVRESNNTNPDDFSKPVIMVIKKNSKVLEHVIEALKAKDELDTGNVLIIDDEADNASVNTKKDINNPSTINSGIRKIFNNFDIATYVGFTATPFANIFIDPQIDGANKNIDLFPSDFIVQLHAPDDYFGAKDVFYNDRTIRIISENEQNFLPTKHKISYCYEGLSPSLKEAINCFIINNALRTLDGYGTKHRSMLINISVYNDIQNDIGRCVEEYISDVLNVFEQDEYKSTEEFIKSKIANDIYTLYQTDKFYDNENARRKHDWERVRKAILPELKKIETIVFNKAVQKSFDYDDEQYVNGARIIAVGGYVLSRGLTLEGLMVSYYNRNSKTYDTMLQMCRWFGYRPKYKHLCRVYMTEINMEGFMAVNDAVIDLRNQFVQLTLRNAKPRDFGLMVKESPDSLATSLMITSGNKMRDSFCFERTLDYSGVVCDTSKISSEPELNTQNEKFIYEMLYEQKNKGNLLKNVYGRYMIQDVDVKDIENFISKLNICQLNFKFDKDTIINYLKTSEFEKWDIAIASGNAKSEVDDKLMFFVFDDMQIQGGKRSFITKKDENIIRIGGHNNRIVDPGIFNAGMNENEKQLVKNKIDELIALQKRDSSTPTANDYLSVRCKPLLVIHPLLIERSDKSDGSAKKIQELFKNKFVYAFSIGFPGTTTGVKMKYRGNEVKRLNMMGEFIGDEEEEEDYDE